MEPDEFLLVSSRDGIEVIGSIVLEDQRLFNRVSCGMEVLLKPVMHPETHNIRWIEVVYIRQDPEHPPVYHPSRKPRVDPVVAALLAYDLTKPAAWEQMDTMYTIKEDRPKRFKWLRNLLNKE